MATQSASNEVVFNLWYVLDQHGMVYFLLGRSYASLGGEAESLAMLRQHAEADHRVAQYFPLPRRFHTTVVEGGKEREVPVIHTDSLATLGGPEVLFNEVIPQLQAQIHAMSGLSLTENPVVCITPLFLETDGTLKVRTDNASF